jgi:hypothetical protein
MQRQYGVKMSDDRRKEVPKARRMSRPFRGEGTCTGL